MITAVDKLLKEKRTRDYASSMQVEVMELEDEVEGVEEAGKG